MKIKNAQIINTMIGRDCNGVLTFKLFMASEYTGYSMGGYALSLYKPTEQKYSFNAKGLEAILKILDIVGENTWETLIGSHVRIKCDDQCSAVDEIGNIMYDKWFNLREFFES